MTILGYIFGIIMGLFCLICSICNFEWFFMTRTARFVVNLIGRTGARIFYIVLGALFIASVFVTIIVSSVSGAKTA